MFYLIYFYCLLCTIWHFLISVRRRKADQDLRCCILEMKSRKHCITHTHFPFSWNLHQRDLGSWLKIPILGWCLPVREIQAIFRVVEWILIHSMHRVKPDGSLLYILFPAGLLNDKHEHRHIHKPRNTSNRMLSGLAGRKKTVIRAYIHTQMQTHTFHLPTHLMWDLCFQLSRVRKEREMEMSDTGVNTEFSLLFGFVDFRSSLRGHQRSTVTQTSNVLQSLHHSHYCMSLTIDMKQNQLRLMNKKKSINRKTQHKTSNHIQVRTQKKVKEKQNVSLYRSPKK